MYGDVDLPECVTLGGGGRYALWGIVSQGIGWGTALSVDGNCTIVLERILHNAFRCI